MAEGWTVPPVDVLASIGAGIQQTAKVCARGHQDPVARAFCASTNPSVNDLAGVQQLVGLSYKNVNLGSGLDGNPAFTLAGHSPSLSLRLTSASNPRAIIFTPPKLDSSPNDSLVALAFTRGEQFIEMAARDATKDNVLRFYLLRFEQSCNQKGCTPTELYSSAVEKSFTGYTLYEDVDLKNTAVDCTRCHQVGATKTLLMQQLLTPWTHFLTEKGSEGGPLLLQDYVRTHGTEAYAGIPGAMIRTSDPEALQRLIENNGFGTQPVNFKGFAIEAEVKASSAGQPVVNDPPGKSATWSSLYTAALQNGSMKPAYHDVRISDPQKRASYESAYQNFMQSKSPTLPDMADVFFDKALADMGIRPQPGASGADIIKQMCLPCHNNSTDTSLSRSKFNAANLSSLSRAEKDLAIERIKLTRTDPKRMPPIRNAELNADEIASLEAELKK